jgi:hybrid cluster-associated redox disulfide protein
LRRRNDHAGPASDAVRVEAMMPDPPLTPNNTIAELLATSPCAAQVLVRRRMHCVGCDIAPFDTIQDACAIYGIAIDEFFADLRRSVATTEDNS